MSKKLFGALIIMASLFLSETAFGQKWVDMMNDPNANFFDVKKEFDAYWQDRPVEKGKGFKQFNRWAYNMKSRVNEQGQFVGGGRNYSVYKQIQQQLNSRRTLPTSDWHHIGPNTVPGNRGGAGRINCLAIHPTNTDIMFVGTPAGGLWRSYNGGQSWSTNTDDLASLGVSDVKFAESDPSIMYLATGDADAGDTYSIGILKSTDNGITWDTTSFDWSTHLKRKVYKLLVHPTNPNIVYAATSIGLYKTVDGGMVYDKLRNGRYTDIEFKPTDPNTVYAVTANSLIRTTDAGSNFTTLNFNAIASTSRLTIAVTPDDANYIYVLAGKSSDQGFGGLYRSTDGGDNFTTMATSPNLLGWNTSGSDSGGQAWFDLALAVSPTNKDFVMVGGVNQWKSFNGGQSWTMASHWNGQGGKPYVHADVHNLYMHSIGGINVVFSCNDGGIFKSVSSGSSWSDLSANISVAQMYKIGISATEEYKILTGWQDNGTNYFSNPNWGRVLGGDGMECIIDYNDPNVMYGSTYYGNINRSTNGGSSWTNITYNKISEQGAWVTPYIMHPTNSSTLYAGMKNVWKTSNKGNSWSRISNFSTSSLLATMAIAPSDANYIYAASDFMVRTTTDGGSNWSSYSANTGYGSGNITYLTVDPTNPQVVYMTKGGFYSGSKVYKSTDAGASWTNISLNLPNIPANCITIDKTSTNNALYVGTDVGVWYTDDTMTEWIPFMDNLPNVVVRELEIFYPTNKIRAATYGRGVYESYTYKALQTGIESDNSTYEKWKIYPNPAKNVLYIQSNLDKNTQSQVQIFNISGQLVLNQMLNNYDPVKAVDINHLPMGTYSIRIIGKNKTISQTFIKN